MEMVKFSKKQSKHQRARAVFLNDKTLTLCLDPLIGTAQETVQTRNPSEIVPFKDLKGQCNLLSGYSNESWQLQVNRCLKLSA